MKKKKVNIIWNFVPKLPSPTMVTLKNGEKIIAGVPHEIWTEGLPAKKFYCPGCKEYFPSWAAVLWRHGMRSKKPNQEKTNATTKKV